MRESGRVALQAAEDNVGLEKRSITCLTCGLSKEFITDAAMANFRLNHLGHRLSAGRVKKEEAESKAGGEGGEERGAEALKASRLVVDVSKRGEAGETELLVAGFCEDGQGFERSFPLSRVREVRELLLRREFTDNEGRVFSWDESAVDLLREAEETLRALEEERAEPRHVENAVKKRAVLNAAARRSTVEDANAVQQAERAPGRLLLAKSSHVQQGEDYEREAERVSKVLKAFRWKIEPTYTIGVLFDDNLSIVTNTGLISKGLISKIEEIGYELVAIDVEGGKPTAWFKRKGAEAQAGVGIGPVDVEAEPGQELANNTIFLIK